MAALTEAVEAEINYLSDGSFINRRFVAPGVEFNTGLYQPHRVTIRNARPERAGFTLDGNGFTLADHKSRVRDFFDKAEVDAVYPGEVVEIVKQLTGADFVAPLGWMARTSGDIAPQPKAAAGYTHQGGLQPPAGEAHVDMLPDRAERMAAAIYAKAAPGGKPYRRFIASSVWRAFSAPPQDWPLAVCDGSSVAPDEGTANTMVVVDALPDREAMLAPMANEDQLPAAAIFCFSPRHRWWYFPDMNRDEILMLKFHDSDRTTAWRTPHTAFHDPSDPAAKIRESIEFRSIAYFT
jgi:hypothetical protein